MELTKFINRNKILNLAVILLAFIVSYNAIYKKQVKEEQLLKQKISEETKKNDVLKSIGKSEETISAYKNLLPQKDANLNINSISNIAKASNVKITSIRPAPEQRYPDYIKLPFNLVLTMPNYHALGKFISEIENSQDVYAVEVVNISLNEQTKELTVNLTVSSIAITD